jgi:FkbM family methyltransferase
MFNNCDPKTNGELFFFKAIEDKIKIIFDIGCRSDSEFLDFKGEVHYFDPVTEFVDKLKTMQNNNSASYFNNFGLGEENKTLYYYPRYQSFYDRVKSCSVSDDANKVLLEIKKAKDYIKEKNITHIDFIKIDTEGYELDVLKGFEDSLKNVKLIQFEYGGTFLDNNKKLIDVIHYLEEMGFHDFSYLTHYGLEPVKDFNDHYQYCNIVCVNKN